MVSSLRRFTWLRSTTSAGCPSHARHLSGHPVCALRPPPRRLLRRAATVQATTSSKHSGPIDTSGDVDPCVPPREGNLLLDERYPITQPDRRGCDSPL